MKVLVIALALLLLVCSCGKKDDDYKILKEKLGGKVLARVGNRELTEEMLKIMVKLSLQQQDKVGSKITEEDKKAMIDDWVRIQLITLEAEHSSVLKDPEFILQSNLQYSGLLTRFFLTQKMEDITISPKEIEDYYKSNKDKIFTMKEPIKDFTVVFVRDSSKVAKTLDKVIKSDFKSLQPEDHDDIDFKKNGGKVGFANMDNTMAKFGPSAGQKIWELDKGKICSEPIPFENGYLVAKCTDSKKKGDILSLNEVIVMIKTNLTEKKKQDRVEKIVETLTEKYKPQRFDTGK
jgi:hypothetical protein